MQGSYSAPTSPAARRTGSPATWEQQGAHGSTRGSPLRAASPATAATISWAGSVGPDMPSAQRSGSPLGVPEAARSESPLATRMQQQALTQVLPVLPDDAFQAGVRHAGWLWKRFGHGHKTMWKRLWFYLVDDRLCYCQADKAVSSSAGGSSSYTFSSSIGGPAASTFFASHSTAGLGSSTSSSAAALAAGQIRYIALDRIPVRPLPHRSHEMDPMRMSHPDVGVAIIDAKALTGQPADSPKRAVFSLVAGSHTHYLAAESQREAQLWVSMIRETWLHCFSHAARTTGAGAAGGVVVSQRLMAENAQLRESIQELNHKVSQSDYEYWRKWVEEKAKNQVLESKLVNAATYEVLVKTGSLKGAATDARVYMELFGPDFSAAGMAGASSAAGGAALGVGVDGGCSGEVRLFDVDSKEKPFHRGALDSFTVVCHNVGLPARLRVWHDNTGCHPDWFLVDVKVRTKGTRDWVVFPCNRWLSTHLDDCRICRELVAGAVRPLMTYQVVVHTSDLRGAGTDANVFVQLHGLLGDGMKQQLMGGATDFDRGEKNEFYIEDADLGELTAITISHDGAGKGPAWHLDHVEITPLPGHQPSSTSRTSSPCGSSSSSPLAQSLVAQQAAGGTSLRNSIGQHHAAAAHAGQQLGVSGSLRLAQAAAAGSAAAREGVTYLFPCGAWLDERLGDGRTERRLQAASTLGSKVWYSLHITTSDVRGAGTDADVHIALTGTEGSSGRLQLPSKLEHFERGQRDTFRLQLPPLGHLQKVLVGHNGRGDAASWHLSLVEVVEEDSGRVTYFAADRWLGATSADGLSEVTLTASSSDPRKALVEYQVCFLTSPLRGSGTDSAVSFELKGDRGSSGSITVAAGREAFERGGSDSFCYSRPWLGQLQQMVVWHDNAGDAAGRGPWHLEAVVVTCSRDQQVVTFPCGRWLSADTQLKVELTPGHVAGLTRYRFDVVTSNVRGAGTDGALSLELAGATAGLSGSSNSAAAAAAAAALKAGPWCLDRPGAFARGQTDTFIVEGVEVGHPARLQVTLQGASLNPDWHLSHIVCTKLEGEDDTEGPKYYFSGERWFDAAHGFTASLTASSRPPGRPDAGQLPYVIKVFTSDIKGAGTDANVSVNIMGLKGHSGWQQLRARQDTFERGQEDSFTLKLPDLGALTHLAIKSDGAGQGPAWHLDKVCITPPATTGSHPGNAAGRAVSAAASRQMSRAASLSVSFAGMGGVGNHTAGEAGSSALLLHAADKLEGSGAAAAGTAGGVGSAAGFGANGQPVWFVARRWLDAAHGLEVLLDAQASDPAKNLVTYQLEVYTSDIKNAGTDSRVFIQLVGDRGSSSPQELQDPSAPDACFARGGGDAFALQLPRLGCLSKVRLWLQGPGSPWQLELIVVTGPEGDVTYFPCGTWLRPAAAGSAAGSGCAVQGSMAATLELPATSQDPRQYLREYNVVIRTSDLRGAGTDAAVYVELVDAAGASSGPQQLPVAGPQAFERGSVDDFRLRCQALGELVALRAGHDGSGAHPGWHLLQVEVTDVSAGRTWFFEADRWLDAGQGDGKTERLLTASTTDPLADRTSYRVTVHTSSKKGARTDGAVFLTLQGSKGPPVTCTAASTSLSLSPRQQHPSTPAAGTPRASTSSSSGTKWLSSSCYELRGSSRAAFEEGGVGSFQLPAMRSLGQLRQVTLELDGSSVGGSCSWHCQHLEVTNSSTGECWLFPCNAWLGSSSRSSSSSSSKPAAADARPARPAGAAGAGAAASSNQVLLYPAPSLDAMWHDKEQEQREQYSVAVYTTDISGAGTDAAVCVTLIGASSEAGPFKLSQPGHNCFERGSCDVFTIQTASKLGQLLQLKVVSDGSGIGSAWHLDTISITAQSSGAITWFYGGRWFDSKAGYEALLEGSASDQRSQLVTYKVTTHTRDVQGAGTDARVHVELRGSSGSSSGPQELNRPLSSSSTSSSSKGCFERGQVDSFELRCMELGELQELVVSHDSSGLAPGWNLACIEVQHVGNGKVWYFPCGQWLDSSQGDRATTRNLKATRDPSSLLCNYRVAVTTGNVRGAGTDAAVYIIIHGSQGSTGHKGLNRPGRNCFERGQRDEFTVSGPDVGEMSHVVVGHNGSGLGPAWYLGVVEVEHLGTGQLLKFKANRWLDDKREGCSLQCELWPDNGTSQPPPPAAPATVDNPSMPRVAWELLVITGEVYGAGTDADVLISLKGSSTSFGPYTLPAGPEAFETGCRDTFTLHTPELGELHEVVIGHNNMGSGAAWFLQGLELKNLATGAKYVFKVAAWLDIQNGCSRTLKAALQPDKPLPGPVRPDPDSSCSYQLELKTSDLEGAGTDAAVFVQLAGVAGESEAMQLVPADVSTAINSRAAFQRGCLDVFILRGLPDVGSFTHLRIGHDGKGAHPAWHLSWVRAVNLTTGARALFTANTWMNSSLPGSSNWLQLAAGPDNPSPAPARPVQLQPGQLGGSARDQLDAAGGSTPSAMKLAKNWLHASRLGQPGYKLTFITSNIMGAGTASKVFFELIGEHGSSGVIYATSQQGQFSRDHHDSFLYPRLPYLGQLYQLRVGSDGSGMFAGWHLRQVEVVHVHSGQRWLFDCHDWIDKKCTWQKVLPAVAATTLAAGYNASG